MEKQEPFLAKTTGELAADFVANLRHMQARIRQFIGHIGYIKMQFEMPALRTKLYRGKEQT